MVKLCFHVTFYDRVADLDRKYILNYDGDANPAMIDMYDVKNRRTFLKRTACPASITPGMLVPGNTVTIMSRQIQ
ncbi:hypothetical protein KIPB_008805 [Kipferlia bialata]|uniref:Uncharacterized protein n=1 Tax=Kipferlia bialata TaxID=797122 RepID=A0A9K3D3E0_9EUKA|nr:hypothetical protein KIPB_008805 [Kipferlia bialata]|eukprot:g8805.t1